MHQPHYHGHNCEKIMAAEQIQETAAWLQAQKPEKLVNLLAARATARQWSLAFYRLPGQKGFRFVAAPALTSLSHEADLNELPAGFLIGSYEGKQYFLEQVVGYEQPTASLTDGSNSAFFDSLNEEKPTWQPYTLPDDNPSTTRDEYINYVQHSIDTINQTELIKTVPSRIKRVTLPAGFEPGTTFIRLCEAYPNAFVSLLSSPQTGTWLGATPESLIEVDEAGIFTTMALAGTQPYDGSAALHTLPWTQKEIEEQAMVGRYIINRFKEIRLREFVETGPRTVQAGNMAHLCTTFTVDTRATHFPDLGVVMLRLLHPTSAVCGMPKEPARQLLKEMEKHQRKLYSGYLGPHNMPDGSHIFVNLRCMEVLNGEALLYAGAGVTAYSVPDEEWQETELKCNTLLNIINS